MDDDFSLDLDESTYKEMLKKKEQMGFGERSYNEWFKVLFNSKGEKTDSKIIEDVFNQNTQERFFDDWIGNFSHNLDNICEEPSAKQLIPEESSNIPSIVIGRGPSIKKNDHLKILSESNFQGNIVCTDGALIGVLESGITPKKFKNFYVLTIDSQKHQAKFYDNKICEEFGQNIKCILSTTIPKEVYNIIKQNKMQIYWLHTLFDYNKGQTSFNYITGKIIKARKSEGLPAIQTGGNVGTASWVISWNILKSKIVSLIGIDHGFDVNTSWEDIEKFHPQNKPLFELDKTAKIFKNAFPKVYNPDFDCHCLQDPLFQFYSNAFRELISKASKKVTTINTTEGGAIFGKDILSMKFIEFLEKYS